MILRRITKHVREQNWFAIGLDFFIVVIGVFIGIQVSNWNESLSQLNRSNAYLERLELDLQSDLEAINSRQKFYSDVLLFGEQALSYVEAQEQNREASWPIILAFFQASQIFHYYPNDATYAEIKSVGELDLIENPDIRSNLVKYYSTRTDQYDFAFRANPKYRETIRGLTPSTVTKYIWDNCHENTQLNEQVFLECNSPIDAVEIQRLLDIYVSRHDVVEELRFWASTLQTSRKLFDAVSASAQSLKGKINAELNKD
jgi:hypothetical protein|tara:strand:+ start:3493 stop:4266 length:774 start_codon:yes stop_codon:yes gene_type:complete